MNQPSTPVRSCPACGSDDYLFRGRKQVPADEAAGRPAGTETRYRCRRCGHEWKVRQNARGA
jgi:DNA-directed RNA polymerase subunit M/transcription elongation factor TFIIS